MRNALRSQVLWRSPCGADALLKVLIFVVGLLMVSIFVMTLSATAWDRSESDRAQIYQVSLEYLIARGKLEPETLLIGGVAESRTGAGSLARQSLVACFRDVADLPELAAALEDANKVSRPVPSSLGQRPHVIIVPVEHYQAPEGGFSWKELDRYGKKENGYYSVPGLLTFSGVGFDSSRRRALVEASYACPLCGFGMYLLLDKAQGWKVVDSCEAWVS